MNSSTKYLLKLFGGGGLVLPAPALTSPADNPVLTAADLLVDYTPTFQWAAVDDATQYRIQIDNNVDFSSPEVNELVSAPTVTYTPGANLTYAAGGYYWRVRVEAPVHSEWSEERRFGLHTPDTYNVNILAPDVWIPLRETSIALANVADNARYTAAPGSELLTNPSFDSGGTGWTETLNGGTSNYTGGQAQITAPGGNIAALSQVVATPGDTYEAVVDIDNTTVGNTQIGVAASGADMILHTTPGVKTTQHVAKSTSLFVRAASPGQLSVWNSVSLKKAGEYDGIYSGPTLNGDTFLGQPCPTFDGVNDFVQLEHNRLEALLKPENAGFEMTLIIPVLMSQAAWESTDFRGFLEIGVDTNNRFDLYHTNVANRVIARAAVGGVATTSNLDVDSSHYGKFALLTATYSLANNRIRLYINKTMSTASYPTAGTWTASALTSTWTRMGAISTGSFFLGSAAYPIIDNREWTADEIGNLYDLMKIHEPDMS